MANETRIEHASETWLADSTVFEVNRVPAHSDHKCYAHDPQTNESAANPNQVAKRLEILDKAILQTSGHTKSLAAVVACTVIDAAACAACRICGASGAARVWPIQTLSRAVSW